LGHPSTPIAVQEPSSATAQTLSSLTPGRGRFVDRIVVVVEGHDKQWVMNLSPISFRSATGSWVVITNPV
jgi:hypothetical protein